MSPASASERSLNFGPEYRRISFTFSCTAGISPLLAPPSPAAFSGVPSPAPGIVPEGISSTDFAASIPPVTLIQVRRVPPSRAILKTRAPNSGLYSGASAQTDRTRRNSSIPCIFSAEPKLTGNSFRSRISLRTSFIVTGCSPSR